MSGQHPSADSLVSRFALLFGGQIAYGAILLVNNILISRWFGPELKGQLALAVFVPYFASISPISDFRPALPTLPAAKRSSSASLPAPRSCSVFSCRSF
jgi:hypothetical protein